MCIDCPAKAPGDRGLTLFDCRCKWPLSYRHPDPPLKALSTRPLFLNLSYPINGNASFAGTHMSKQLIRAGTSAALNYAEAQSAESRRDFIHKLKIGLKELRESYMCLTIIHKSRLFHSADNIQLLLKENNELISIFVKSIETAQKNQE